MQQSISLHQQLQQLKDAEQAEIYQTTQAIRAKYQHQRTQIETKIIRAKEGYYESLRFDSYQTITVKELSALTIPQLTYLVYKYHGYDTKDKHSRYRDPTTLGRGYLSDVDFKERLITKLTDEHCRYCKSLTHLKDKCPRLLVKVCDACSRQGHSVDKCTDIKAMRQAYIEKQIELEYHPGGELARGLQQHFESLTA